MTKMETEMERFKLDRSGEQANGIDAFESSGAKSLILGAPVEVQRETVQVKSEEVCSELDQVLKEIESEQASAAERGQQVEEQSENSGSKMSSDRESTPLSSSSLMGGPLAGLGGSNRATTTERRTTTTTTTKRTVKSSDDFIPTATDIQQVRSESRTGSISSNAPIYSTSGANSHQQQSSSSSSTTTTTSSKQQGASGTNKAWTEDLQSPLVQDTEEGRVLKLRFDVTQYEPDEIVVKTVDNRLTVHAKHEERSENRSVYREYNREFHLPDGTDVELIKSSLSKDGILTVDCPLPAPQVHGTSRRIPIEKV